MKARHLLSILVPVCLAAAACSAHATDDAVEPAAGPDAERDVEPVDEAALQQLLDEFREENHIYGTQLAVRIPGQPDLFLASGVDDRMADPPTPMPTDGTFHIASVTKTFTSAVVLQLIEEGRLRFDDTLAEWLPDYPYADQITIRMMLGHTSGMATYSEDETSPCCVETWFGDPSRVYTLAEVMELNASIPPHAPPPTPLDYSNGNYYALGYIIEDVTGRPLADVFAERIFDPYGLDDTVLDVGVDTTVTQHGWYGLDGRKDPDTGTFDPTAPREFDVQDVPDTAARTFMSSVTAGISSSADLLDWAEALYGGAFLGDAMTTELLTLDERDTWAGGDRRFGLGVQGWCPCDETTDPPTPSLVGHFGSMSFGTTVLVAYDLETGVIVVNRSNVFDVTHAARDELLADVVDVVGADS